ncbi:branched-chain amino acid ABC transporter permease [Acetobacter sp. DsW_059]|nr:branched-chain amino acid ABC transporter permease [Acetobacter sp. DsW_059]
MVMSVNTCADDAPPGAASEFWRAVRTSFPVAMSFIPFGLVLGAQARMQHLSSWQVPVMTGLNFGGGSEFAAVGLWTSPPHILLIVSVTFLINSRHLLMGAVFAPYLNKLSRFKALVCLFFMCDEAWALSLSDCKKRGFSLPYYTGVAGMLYFNWVLSTFAGALLGPVLGDVTRYGFDMAFPAVFFVLLKGMWKGLLFSGLPWVVSLAVAITAYLYLPKGWYVPCGALAGLTLAWWQARA